MTGPVERDFTVPDEVWRRDAGDQVQFEIEPGDGDEDFIADGIDFDGWFIESDGTRSVLDVDQTRLDEHILTVTLDAARGGVIHVVRTDPQQHIIKIEIIADA